MDKFEFLRIKPLRIKKLKLIKNSYWLHIFLIHDFGRRTFTSPQLFGYLHRFAYE